MQIESKSKLFRLHGVHSGTIANHSDTLMRSARDWVKYLLLIKFKFALSAEVQRRRLRSPTRKQRNSRWFTTSGLGFALKARESSRCMLCLCSHKLCAYWKILSGLSSSKWVAWLVERIRINKSYRVSIIFETLRHRHFTVNHKLQSVELSSADKETADSGMSR